MVLSLKLFGPFSLTDPQGNEIALPTRKTRALLAHLGIKDGARQPRERLMDLLWSDRAEPQARQSLNAALNSLRKLGRTYGVELIESDRESAAVVTAVVDTDVVRFRQCRQLDASAAAGHYGGTLLDGFSSLKVNFDDWLSETRRQLHREACETFDLAIAQAKSEDSRTLAIALAENLLKFDPAQEEVHRGLIQLRYDMGDRAAALRQYEACVLALQRELSVEPDARTLKLKSVIEAKPASPGYDNESINLGRLPTTRHPKIAVQSFQNQTDISKFSLIGQGLAEDVGNELARFRTLNVVSAHSAKFLDQLGSQIEPASNVLSLDYMVQGSIRSLGTRIRISVHLVEVQGGATIWAEKYDQEEASLFKVIDEIVRTIVSMLAGRIEEHTVRSGTRKLPGSLDSYELALRARKHFFQVNFCDNLEARRLYELASDLDQDYAVASAGIAKTYFVEWWNAWADDLNKSQELHRYFAERSIDLDASESRAQTALGVALLYAGQFDISEEYLDRAIELNPSDARAITYRATHDIYASKIDDAIKLLLEAKRLDPFGKINWFLARAYFAANDYEQAIKEIAGIRGIAPMMYPLLISSYVHAGRGLEARQTVKTFLTDFENERSKAGISTTSDLIRLINERMPFQDPHTIKMFNDGLLDAGMTS